MNTAPVIRKPASLLNKTPAMTGDDGSMTGDPSYLTAREHSAFGRYDGLGRFQQPAIVRVHVCVCMCVCNTIVYKYLSSCHYKEKVKGIDGLAMTGRVSLTRHTRHYDRDRPPSPSVHTAVALAQFPTPARHAAPQPPSTRTDGLRVIPSASGAPTPLPDAPCGREGGL